MLPALWKKKKRHKFQVRPQTLGLKTSPESQDALVFCDWVVREHIRSHLE